MKKASIQKPSSSKLTPLQMKMQKKLLGGKFRWINEKLYTSSSNDSMKMFKNDPSLFAAYHEGFSSQVQSWPKNPVEIFIEELLGMEKRMVVADMGCGDAKVSQSCSSKHEIHSFDLVAANSHVTVADIAKVPLSKDYADIVIFCLSLMGTNYTDFIKEAHRIMKINGKLKVAEVSSRIPDLSKFQKDVEKLGFRLIRKNQENTHFVIFEFEKYDQNPHFIKPTGSLKPCKYKKR